MKNNVNTKKVIRSGVGYIVGNYLIKGLSFLTIPIFTRLMTISDYGLFNIFVAYESFLSIFIGLAINSSYKNAKYKYAKDEKLSYNGYVSSTMILLIASGSIWLLAIILLSIKKINIIEIDIISMFILVLYSFGIACINCYNSYVALEFKSGNYVLISGINAISNIMISILLMLTILSNNRYYARIVGCTLPIMAISLWIIVQFLKKSKPSNILEYWKWGIKYSIPIIPHGISQIVLSQFDRIMINKMIGSLSAGIYSFAYNIFAIVQVTSSSLDNAWTPWFFEQMKEKNYKEIKQKSAIYIMCMAFFIIIVMMISPEIVKLLGTKQYWESMHSVIPILAGGFFAFLYTIPSGIEYFYEKTKCIAFGSVIAAVINIVLNYFFIKKYGYLAAAYTTLFTYVVYFVFHYILAKRIHGYNVFSNIVIGLSSFGVILFSFIAELLVEKFIFRYIIVLIFLIIFFYMEEKYYGILKKIMYKNKKD